MTLEETKEVLKFLRGCYPAFYRKMSDSDWENVLLAWSTLFSDKDYMYDMVFDAVRKCVAGKLTVRDCGSVREATDGGYRKFPPQPGVIVEALEGEREIGYYARRLRLEREKRRLQANLPGGHDNGQQDENRVVYAYTATTLADFDRIP